MKYTENIDKYDNIELSALIDLYVRNERDRKMLKRRFIDRIKFEPLAEEFGLSVRQTQNIIYRAQERLFKNI